MNEGTHGVLRAQGMFNGSEEVVGLEDEDHLTVDKGQNVRNLLDELLSIRFDLLALERPGKI